MIKWGLKDKFFDAIVHFGSVVIEFIEMLNATTIDTMYAMGTMDAIAAIDTIFDLEGAQCSGMDAIVF